MIVTVTNLAEKYADTVMCGYTHLQRAQPITFGQHLLAYAFMLLRDLDRLRDCRKRMNVSPLGSCALAGTGFPIDRMKVAELLGMDGVSENSLDGVSDRDFAAELAFVISLIMMHLSRFSEEVILWCSWEFKYIELDDSFSTGSSIMPQKKNADIAELVRARPAGLRKPDYLLTILKGLRCINKICRR
jgi:argininosuccinate lyase